MADLRVSSCWQGPLKILLLGPYKINQGPTKKDKKRRNYTSTQFKGLKGPVTGRGPFFTLLEPLKFIVGLPKWIFCATEGPLLYAADRALFLTSALNPPLPITLPLKEMTRFVIIFLLLIYICHFSSEIILSLVQFLKQNHRIETHNLTLIIIISCVIVEVRFVKSFHE